MPQSAALLALSQSLVIAILQYLGLSLAGVCACGSMVLSFPFLGHFLRAAQKMTKEIETLLGKRKP
jgi:hypothetical protein